MLSPQSIRGFLEISNNDYRKAEPLLCNANLRICMQKDLSLTSLLGSSMGITFNFILKLEPLLTSQHSQSFLEGFQVFHWKLLLTGPAILSLLLPSCQTEKTNNWEVVDSLSQSAIFPPLVAFHQDQHWKNMQQFNSYSPSENFILNLYFAESLLYSSVVFSSVFFANTTNQLERYILPFLL